MSDFPSLRLQQRTSQTQKQTQVQTQKLNQQQLLSVKMLAMSSSDLRREIYDTVAKNPALVISNDSTQEGIKDVRIPDKSYSNIKVSSVSKAAQLASDNFQSALESSPDTRETLCDHLEHQFMSVNHSEAEEKIGLALIHNLDDKGFHILDPYSLLDKKDHRQTGTLLEKTMDYIRQLDPVGTCCKNFEESLFVQAKIRSDAPPAALFILDGHFDFLNPPQPLKIQKKIKDYILSHSPQSITSQITPPKTIGSFQSEVPPLYTEEEIAQAIEYIKKLDPFPARDFSPSENAYIVPDVYVEKDSATGKFVVRVNDEVLPAVEISKDFYELSLDRSRVTKSTEKTERKRSEHRFVMDSVRQAKEFIENLEFRRKTLLTACQYIVGIQSDFFEKGRMFLKPLRQKEIAALLGVHEATVSRMANEKYLRCSQGLFKISFFFSNAVGSLENHQSDSKKSLSQLIPSSKEGVQFVLKQILEEHKNDTKPLSDQKLAALLLQQGIKIARRTVAKYRSQLNIDSSYTR